MCAFFSFRDALIAPEEPAVRLHGEGYMIFDRLPYQMKPRSDITFNFKTYSKEGLLFLVFKDENFLSIELREGRVLYQVMVLSVTVEITT